MDSGQYSGQVSQESQATDMLEDDVFDEHDVSELLSNYERLMKEHLQLERAFSLMQNNTDMNLGWQRDKVNLLKSLQELQEQVTILKGRLRECEEQNEDLEFRTLELEETNNKVRDHSSILSGYIETILRLPYHHSL